MTETRQSRRASRAARERALADHKLHREAEVAPPKRKSSPGGQRKKRGFRPPGAPAP